MSEEDTATGTLESAADQPDENQTPEPKLFAGKYKSVEELEKAYQHEQSKISELAERGKHFQSKNDELIEIIKRSTGQQEQRKAGPSLEELAEQINEKPSKVLELIFERDAYFNNQLQSMKSENERLRAEQGIEPEIKSDVDELHEKYPNMSRVELANMVKVMRGKYMPNKPLTQTPQRIMNPGNPGASIGRTGGRGGSSESEAMKLAASAFGWSDDDMKMMKGGK